MTPEAYCRSKVARPGDSLYYALRFTPPPPRPALLALYALRCELMETETMREPGLAQARLAWWREELERATRGNAQHPVARALTQAAHRQELDLPSLLALPAEQADFVRAPYAAYAEFERYARAFEGRVQQASWRLCGGGDDDGGFSAAVAVGLAFTPRLRDAGRAFRRGQLRLPLEDLARHGLSTLSAPSTDAAPAFGELLAAECARARMAFREAFALLPQRGALPALPTLVLATIDFALLGELEAAAGDVLRQRIDLTPLRKFWLAWRTARRLRLRSP